jgi:hypothetical protein
LYKERASDTQRIAVEADEIAQLIVKLISVSKDNYWEGSPAELLAYIRMLNDQFKVVPEKLLPQAPNTLMKKVNLLATDLLDTERIEISQKKVAKGKRLVIIRKLPDQSLDTTFNGGNDDNSPPPVVSPAGEVRKVPPLPPPEPLSSGVAIPDKSTATQPPPATRTATPDDQHETDAGGDRGDRGDSLHTLRGDPGAKKSSPDTTAKSENNKVLPPQVVSTEKSDKVKPLQPVPGMILTVCIRCGQIKPCLWQGEGQDRHAICEECLGRHREL